MYRIRYMIGLIQSKFICYTVLISYVFCTDIMYMDRIVLGILILYYIQTRLCPAGLCMPGYRAGGYRALGVGPVADHYLWGGGAIDMGPAWTPPTSLLFVLIFLI